MTPETVTLIGIGVSVMLVAVRQEQLRRRPGTNGNGSKDATETLHRQVSELHTWHDKEDPNHPGAKLWWGVSLIALHRDILQLGKDMEASKIEFTKQHRALLGALQDFKESLGTWASGLKRREHED